jgi:hypothetical protein
MLASLLWTVAQQVATTAQSALEFSQSTPHHAMAPETHGPLDVTLVALGVVVVIVTTSYSLLYLIRPGETNTDHIKRRILEDGREEFR